MALILIGTVHRDPVGKGRLLAHLHRIRPSVVSLEVSPASVALRRAWGRGWMRAFKKNLRAIGTMTGETPARLLAGSGIRGVFEYLRMPYEYRSGWDYARSAGVPLLLIDDSEVAAAFLSRVHDEILSLSNLELLAEDGEGRDLAVDVGAEYVRARRILFEGFPWSNKSGDDPRAWEARQKREAALARKVRLLHQGLMRKAGQTLNGRGLADALIVPNEAVGYLPDQVRLPEDPVHVYIGGWEHLIDDEDVLYTRLKDLGAVRRLCADPVRE